MLRCFLLKMFVKIFCANCVPTSQKLVIIFGCVKLFGLANIDLSTLPSFYESTHVKTGSSVKPFVLKA
jgi:hypothetical protein